MMVMTLIHLGTSHQLAGSLPPRSSPVTVQPFSHFALHPTHLWHFSRLVNDLRPEDGPAIEIMAREKFGTNVRLSPTPFDLSFGVLT
jgi:hypothetical protein